MPGLICPVCSKPLFDCGASYKCPGGHCFDKARKGYVNLNLASGARSKRHGDDTVMVASRSEFLDRGFYSPLLREIISAALRHVPAGSAGLLDAGCGEGYYTAAVAAALRDSGRDVSAVGVDLSRAALAAAHRRDPSLVLAAASAKKLPVADSSCDIVLSVFAPVFPEEFARVLRPGGVLIRAVPLERHLFGLKAAVYDEPYLNPPPGVELAGFELTERADVEYTLSLDGEEAAALFKMTPYYYKTGRADQEKLGKLPSLTTEAAFGVFTYARTSSVPG